MLRKKKNYVSKWSKTLMVIVVGLLFLSCFPTTMPTGEETPNIPEVTKNGPGKVYPNQVFDYTISFTNEGNGTAVNVSVVDILPEHVNYQGSAPQGSYDPNNYTVTWNFPAVLSDQTINIILTVQVKQDAPHETGLYNGVELTYEDSQQTQYGPIHGFTIASVMASPMLDVTCEAPLTADAGQPFSYTINIFNKGYPSAINVEVTDHLSPGVIYVGSAPPGQYNQMYHTVTWTFGSIEPDQTVYIQLNVTAKNDLSPATNLANIVEVWWRDPMLELYGPVLDEDTTTITGNWIVENGQIITRIGEPIVVTGSIIVETGGRLSLNNVNLKMKDPPGPEDFGIYVMEGGELAASYGTLIEAFEPSEPYLVYNWGDLQLINVAIKYIRGFLPDQGGIVNFAGAKLYCNESKIAMSESVGITVAHGAWAFIEYSYIEQNDGDGIHAEGFTHIKNSVIRNNNGSGIYWLHENADAYLMADNVLIENNGIGIFCESPVISQGRNLELENICSRYNYIDNIMMFNFKPKLRGEHLQMNDNTVVISSGAVPAFSVPTKNYIQVKVVDDDYNPVQGARVIVDDWEEDIACDDYTDEHGFVRGIEVVEKAGTPDSDGVPPNYLTNYNLEMMPYLNTYYEINGGITRMRPGYYYNIIPEEDLTYQEHKVIVDPQYTALEGYQVINPDGVFNATSSYKEHPAMNALDYDLSTYWSADSKIGNYTLMIDLTDPEPIRFVNIYYQCTEGQSWFEGQSYVVEGYNESTQEWEEMCKVENEENVPERRMEVPQGYWDQLNPSGWVSKVRMRIIGWSGPHDPGIRLFDIQDLDSDGILNWFEDLIDTIIWAYDSDGDGMPDYYELKYGKPLNPWSWFSPTVVNKRYAVLIGKDDWYPWFWDDVMLAYYMLFENRGFSHSNIYMLYDDGNMDPDNDYISWYPTYNVVDNSATLSNIDSTFSTLGMKMTGNDLVFVYLVDHGSANNLDGTVSIYGGVIRDDQLDTYVNRITSSARKVITVDACFSGSFIDDLSDQNRVISTCAPYDDYGWGDGWYTFYARYYLGALNGKYSNGNNGWTTINADYDGNGDVSIKEAYVCDVKNDPMNYAMYDDNGDPWDPNDPNNDGPGYHGDFSNVDWGEGLLGGDTYLGKPCDDSIVISDLRVFPVKEFPYW